MLNKKSIVFLFILIGQDLLSDVGTQLRDLEISLELLSNKVPRIESKFFIERLLGVSEKDFQTNQELISRSFVPGKKEGFYTLIGVGNKEYHMGKFEILGLSDLRKEFTSFNENNGTLNVVEAISPQDPFKKHVDIVALQAQGEYKKAVFQVACGSFNTVPQASKEDDLRNIARNQLSRAQAAQASVSAGPGYIFRNYYYYRPADGSGSPFDWRQTLDHQINLLEGTGIPLEKGYVQLPANPPFEPDRDRIENNYKVGYLQDTQVVFSNLNPLKNVERDDQLIDQVFVGTLTFDYNRSAGQSAQETAKILQECAYEATIKAAALKGRKSLFLTMVGVGQAQNDPQVIANFLKSNADLIKKSGLKITLVIYDSASLQNKEQFLNTIQQVVKQTGGSYMLYSKDFPQGQEIKVEARVALELVPVAKPQPVVEGVMRPRDTFFEDVVGVKESDFKKNAQTIKDSIRKEGDEIIIIGKDNREYRAGKLELTSIGDLRAACQNLAKPRTGTFNVIEAISPLTPQNLPKSFARYVDIGSNQANPQYQDAVFQVASNFNCLELLSKQDPMTNITGYTKDKTQGPFASLSAAPGLIYRHYYYYWPHNEMKNPMDWRQKAVMEDPGYNLHGPQINLLENTEIPVLNGYVNFTDDNALDVDINKIKVGFHQNEQVTFGKVVGNQHEMLGRNDQIIHQVFTAAVSFQGSDNKDVNNQKRKNASDVAQTVQQAAYEGTIRAAYIAGKKKVFLTLVGGGVFDNDFSWIQKAIVDQKQLIKDSGLEVILIIYDSMKIPQDRKDEFLTAMKDLVQETGGAYLTYSDQNPQGEKLV